jgi:hypothetical protein
MNAMIFSSKVYSRPPEKYRRGQHIGGVPIVKEVEEYLI